LEYPRTNHTTFTRNHHAITAGVELQRTSHHPSTPPPTKSNTPDGCRGTPGELPPQHTTTNHVHHNGRMWSNIRQTILLPPPPSSSQRMWTYTGRTTNPRQYHAPRPPHRTDVELYRTNHHLTHPPRPPHRTDVELHRTNHNIVTTAHYLPRHLNGCEAKPDKPHYHRHHHPPYHYNECGVTLDKPSPYHISTDHGRHNGGIWSYTGRISTPPPTTPITMGACGITPETPHHRQHPTTPPQRMWSYTGQPTLPASSFPAHILFRSKVRGGDGGSGIVAMGCPL